MRSRIFRALTLVIAIPLFAGTMAAAGSGGVSPSSSSASVSHLKPIVGSALGHAVHITPGSKAPTAHSQFPPLLRHIPSPGQQPALSSPARNQRQVAQQPPSPSAPVSLGTGFQGLAVTANGGPRTWHIPADPNGAIGTDGSGHYYYVEMVNEVFAVWNVTGAPLRDFAPTHITKLFPSKNQGLCHTTSSGDPVVLFDSIADRFFISELAINLRTNVYYDCIAIAQTADPSAGTWYSYAFRYPKPFLNDYPKFGVWPDAYYGSFNQYRHTSKGFYYEGAGAIAYDRTAMLSGAPAKFVYFNLYNVKKTLVGMLPSSVVGPTLPPAGTPDIYELWDTVRYWRPSADQIELWGFHVNFAGGSSFTKQLASPLPVHPFTPWICGLKFHCVPQKGSRTLLDTLNLESMFPLEYRNDGTNQHLVFTNSIRSKFGTSGIRWYDVQEPTVTTNGSGWTVAEQGTYQPDAKYRWMGSAGINATGDIAIGFSISSRHIHPEVGVAGRCVTDGTGQMPMSSIVHKGSGSETGSYGRWGDYSSMWVDPRDDNTFWFTSMYYNRNDTWHWGTWVQSFTLPGVGC
jgi:hypothetical protein